MLEGCSKGLCFRAGFSEIYKQPKSFWAFLQQWEKGHKA